MPTSVATNPYAANPFPRLSRQAQALKHPPGIDTVAYWGNGRFSVVLNDFFDDELKHLPTFRGIRVMRQEGAAVYFTGDDGFLILDLAAAAHRQFATREIIPADLAEPFAKLQDMNDTQNIVFDPKTLLPVRMK